MAWKTVPNLTKCTLLISWLSMFDKLPSQKIMPRLQGKIISGCSMMIDCMSLVDKSYQKSKKRNCYGLLIFKKATGLLLRWNMKPRRKYFNSFLRQFMILARLLFWEMEFSICWKSTNAKFGNFSSISMNRTN